MDDTPPAAGSATPPRDPLLQLVDEINVFAGEVLEQSESVRAWQERCNLLLQGLRAQHDKLLAGQGDTAELLKANGRRIEQMITALGTVGRGLDNLGQQHGQVANRLEALSQVAAHPPAATPELRRLVASLGDKITRLAAAQTEMRDGMAKEIGGFTRALGELQHKVWWSAAKASVLYGLGRVAVLAFGLVLVAAGAVLGGQYMHMQDWFTMPPRCASEPYATNLGPHGVWPISIRMCIVGPAEEGDRSLSELHVCAEPPFLGKDAAGMTDRFCRVLESVPVQ